MEVVLYDEKAKSLHVRYNTNTVWKYTPVTAEMYEGLKTSKDPDRFIKNLFHDSAIVGVAKEDL